MRSLIDENQKMRRDGALTTAELWRGAAKAIGVAVVANLGLLAAANASGIDHVVVPQPGVPSMTVSAPNVLVVTVAAMTVGFAVTDLVRRRWSDATKVMQIIGGVLAVASVAMPLGTAAATTATRVSLMAMHLITGAAFVTALARLRRS